MGLNEARLDPSMQKPFDCETHNGKKSSRFIWTLKRWKQGWRVQGQGIKQGLKLTNLSDPLFGWCMFWETTQSTTSSNK
jgi:hypothetical protein